MKKTREVSLVYQQPLLTKGCNIEKKLRGFPRHYTVNMTLVGFARTLFLRALTDAPALPFRFHIHGFFTTGWVVLFLVQTFLIENRKISFHRRMGEFGAFIAGGVLLSGLVILYYVAAGYPENGFELGYTAAAWLDHTYRIGDCKFRIRAQPDSIFQLIVF